MFTSDDLDLQTVLANMKTNGITMFELHTNNYANDYWTYWTGLTGGKVFITGGSGDPVVNAIKAAVETGSSMINELTLKAQPGYESWVAWTPPEYTDVGGSISGSFDVTITAPPGTAPGDHSFKIYLVGDGAELASQDVLIHVRGGTNVPEFPSITIPLVSVLGIMFLISRKKH